MLRPGRTRRAVPRRYRVTPGRNGARARPFGSQPAIHLYAPHRFVAHSVRDLRFRLHQNGPAVPGPSRRIPSRRADQRASAAGAVASASAYRGLSLRQAARGPCGSTPSGSIVSRRIPSITASTRAGTGRKSGLGAARSCRPRGGNRHPCLRAAGISTRTNVRPARRYRSRPPAQPIGACGSRAN